MSHKYLYDLFSTAEYLNSFEFNDLEKFALLNIDYWLHHKLDEWPHYSLNIIYQICYTLEYCQINEEQLRFD